MKTIGSSIKDAEQFYLQMYSFWMPNRAWKRYIHSFRWAEECCEATSLIGVRAEKEFLPKGLQKAKKEKMTKERAKAAKAAKEKSTSLR